MARFEIVGAITGIETIAAGPRIRVLPYLQEAYGSGRWRKLKGTARIRLPDGSERKVELHWCEAHGTGK